MADRLEPVRRSFDDIAEPFAAAFADEFSRKPFDRELLTAFAARIGPAGRVLDLGCGAAGQVGRFVADLGVAVTGVDFSEPSIALARAANPGLDFVAADVRALPFETGSVAGVVAFYRLIYGSDDDVLAALVEIRRVLEPGSPALIAVHGGARDEHWDDYQGIAIDVTIRMTSPAAIAALVERTGLRIDEIRAREPYDFELASRRIYVSATATPLRG